MIQYDNIITEHRKLDILPPLPPTWGRASINMYYIVDKSIVAHKLHTSCHFLKFWEGVKTELE